VRFALPYRGFCWFQTFSAWLPFLPWLPFSPFGCDLHLTLITHGRTASLRSSVCAHFFLVSLRVLFSFWSAHIVSNVRCCGLPRTSRRALPHTPPSCALYHNASCMFCVYAPPVHLRIFLTFPRLCRLLTPGALYVAWVRPYTYIQLPVCLPPAAVSAARLLTDARTLRAPAIVTTALRARLSCRLTPPLPERHWDRTSRFWVSFPFLSFLPTMGSSAAPRRVLVYASARFAPSPFLDTPFSAAPPRTFCGFLPATPYSWVYAHGFLFAFTGLRSCRICLPPPIPPYHNWFHTDSLLCCVADRMDAASSPAFLSPRSAPPHCPSILVTHLLRSRAGSSFRIRFASERVAFLLPSLRSVLNDNVLIPGFSVLRSRARLTWTAVRVDSGFFWRCRNRLFSTLQQTAALHLYFAYRRRSMDADSPLVRSALPSPLSVLVYTLIACRLVSFALLVFYAAHRTLPAGFISYHLRAHLCLSFFNSFTFLPRVLFLRVSTLRAAAVSYATTPRSSTATLLDTMVWTIKGGSMLLTPVGSRVFAAFRFDYHLSTVNNTNNTPPLDTLQTSWVLCVETRCSH